MVIVDGFVCCGISRVDPAAASRFVVLVLVGLAVHVQWQLDKLGPYWRIKLHLRLPSVMMISASICKYRLVHEGSKVRRSNSDQISSAVDGGGDASHPLWHKVMSSGSFEMIVTLSKYGRVASIKREKQRFSSLFRSQGFEQVGRMELVNLCGSSSNVNNVLIC